MIEIWKDVESYEGLYRVSNYGVVISHKKNVPVVLKPWIHQGYAHVELFMKNKGKINKVHRLVAKAFIPNPENKPQVNHIDGNKMNNELDNLEWSTPQENIDHAYSIGIMGPRKSVNMYTLDGVFIKRFESTSSADRYTGVNQGNVCKVCNGHNKTAGGYKWEYAK